MTPPLLVRVHVGDLIEFSYGTDEDHNKTMLEGRVMDVDPATPHECVVQVSPFEPFKRVDLSKVLYKVVYGIGEMTRVTMEMIGWELEIPQSGHHSERGVIKQVDSALNCALLAFDDGQKDWRDLTMNAFKVVGRHFNGVKRSNSPMKQAKTVEAEPQALIQGVYAIRAPIPVTEPSDFDWYSEGGHVELCDRDGRFMEGALLCAQRGQSLQLYNEKRQFFEIQINKQGFKVVIHGLVSVKSTVPLGQAVEIYSPMHGEFRSGTVMKVAEIGKLTPIRFLDVGLEWLDLTSQTFKLVFHVDDKSDQATTTLQPTMQAKSGHASMEKESISEAEPVQTPTPMHQQPHQQSEPQKTSQQEHSHSHHNGPPHATVVDQELESPTRTRTSRRHHHSHKHAHQLPILELGQTIELFDSASKQFAKYRVTRVLHPDQAHHYDVEPNVDPSSSGSGLLRSIPASKPTISLAEVKARLLLHTEHMKTYQPLLRGFRVDVYDKLDRSVLTGKIVECTLPSEEDGASDAGRVHVKLKDGTKRWFDVKATKIKLKLQGERHMQIQSTANETVEEPSPSPSRAVMSEPEMWQRVDPARPKSPQVTAIEESKLSQLNRQQSEKIVRGNMSLPTTDSPLIARHTSLPEIARVQEIAESSSPARIPSLDFSNISRSRAEPVLSTPQTIPVDVHSDSRRSSGSNADALSDLLPPMDDVWTEELTGNAEPTRYVHATTGQMQHDRPQWLKTVDETTGETQILNTITGVRFQLPGGGSSSLTTSPATSGRAVVTLPVGPLEAARVVSQLNTATVDLLEEAFGT